MLEFRIALNKIDQTVNLTTIISKMAFFLKRFFAVYLMTWASPAFGVPGEILQTRYCIFFGVEIDDFEFIVLASVFSKFLSLVTC